MLFGILSGFAAASFNSVGYLFSSRFLLSYKDPVRLLFVAQVAMLIISLPFMVIFFPFTALKDEMLKIIIYTIAFCALFFMGQGAFFAALRHFEASRLSSLLGLKIIVMTIIFMILGRGVPNILQLVAILVAVGAAVMFNWSGGAKSSLKGWLFLPITLVCYSTMDVAETEIVKIIAAKCDIHFLHSALLTVPFIYAALGFFSLPGLFFFRPTVRQFTIATPYALLWLLSQAALLTCFALINPLFGNIILATRGILSVIIGALLPLFGFARLDSRISVAKWIQRGVAALLMLSAIALYSYANSR